MTLWDVGASVLAPIFAGGRLTANLDAATAQRDQAALRVLPHPRVREGREHSVGACVEAGDGRGDRGIAVGDVVDAEPDLREELDRALAGLLRGEGRAVPPNRQRALRRVAPGHPVAQQVPRSPSPLPSTIRAAFGVRATSVPISASSHDVIRVIQALLGHAKLNTTAF